MPTNIARVLQTAYSKLPPWAQIAVFFALLGFSFYLYIAPRFVNGQIVADVGDGGFIPYRGAELQTHIEGRLLKFRSSEDGYWSVPVISRLPTAIRISVKHEDRGTWHEVVLNASQIWTSDVRIWVDEKPPYVRSEVLASPNRKIFVSWLESIFENFLPAAANAADFRLPSAAMGTSVDGFSQKELLSMVAQTISQVTGKGASEIATQFPWGYSSGPTYTQRIRIVSSLERQLKMEIPDDHWRAMRTVGELVDYLVKRKKLEAAQPEIYKDITARDWSTIQQQLPYSLRPAFK